MTCARLAGTLETFVLFLSSSSCMCNLTVRWHPALLLSSPQAPFLRIPASPCHQAAFCLCFHRRGCSREDKVRAEETLSCFPCPHSGSAGAHTLFCRRTARVSLPCRRNYCLAQGRQQLEGSHGPVERTEL